MEGTALQETQQEEIDEEGNEEEEDCQESGSDSSEESESSDDKDRVMHPVEDELWDVVDSGKSEDGGASIAAINPFLSPLSSSSSPSFVLSSMPTEV